MLTIREVCIVSGIIVNYVSLFEKQTVLSLPLSYHTQRRFLLIIDVSMRSTALGFFANTSAPPLQDPYHGIHLCRSLIRF